MKLNRIDRWMVAVALLICIPVCIARQQQKVINTTQEYQKTLRDAPAKKMVSLLDHIPGVIPDIRYATPNNCIGKKLYDQPMAFLRREPAEALKKVQTGLQKQGLSLVIYDAYRPLSVTKAIWEKVHDRRYAADPANGSGHNRGLSVDITLCYAATHKRLDMGTDFDSFSDSASFSFKYLPADIIANRSLLRKVMMQCGFVPLETEWWHFSWPNTGGCEILDLDFDTLDKTLKK